MDATIQEQCYILSTATINRTTAVLSCVTIKRVQCANNYMSLQVSGMPWANYRHFGIPNHNYCLRDLSNNNMEFKGEYADFPTALVRSWTGVLHTMQYVYYRVIHDTYSYFFETDHYRIIK